MIAALIWLICLGLSIPVSVLALECLIGAFARAGVRAGGRAPPFTVLMPAHNEAGGIARSVKAVTAQLRAGDRLIVIADNCTDDTAEIARGLGATVVARSDPERRGKGYALELGRKFLDAKPGEVVIIVDADCSPAPHALTRLANTAAKRHAVVQGAYLLAPPADATAIVRVSCFAFLVKNLVRQLALRRLAGTALLQGSGMAFPWSIFRRVEWCSASLVEDLDMGLNLLLGGNMVVFDDAAIFSSDASSQGGTAGQRRRWEHGMLQSMASFVPRLVGAGLAGRVRLLFVALDLMIPPTVLLIIVAAVATAFSLVVAGFSSPVIILLISELALVAGLCAAWLKHGRAVLPLPSIRDALQYMLWKLPIFAQFVTSRQRHWTRTERAMSDMTPLETPPAYGRDSVGFVIIGRNEEERLATCISSILKETHLVVYVDSGSVDGSVGMASRYGVGVVELDPAIAFTAARARNAGVEWLRSHRPVLSYIHFVDGDCELVSGWLSAALAAMHAERDLGVVCGRRRERYPGASPYNRLCDREWDTPIGIVESCGGDSLFRLDVFLAAGGFSADLIAGEEPDLCHRVRRAGWRIRRIDADMTVHDAAMTRFGQWWQRNRRSGYAAAEALVRRGSGNPRLWRQVISNIVWALPILWPLWPVLWLRVCMRDGPLEASFITLGKLPHLQGQVDYWRSRDRLIEYK